MWYRAERVRWLALFVVAVLFGIGLETTMDPLEDDGLAWVGILAGMVAIGAVGWYWHRREIQPVPEADERQQVIERHASRLAHGVLLVGVTGFAIVLAVPLYAGPAWPVLVGLVVSTVAVHELAIEYYRRQM